MRYAPILKEPVNLCRLHSEMHYMRRHVVVLFLIG